MQEEVENKSVNLAVKTGKVSVKLLLRALAEYKRHRQSKRQIKKVAKDTSIKGKQSVKELVGQNQGVSSMEIGDSGIKDFKRIANKYGVDFAIVKDKGEDPPKYTVFFKARDADAITSVLKEYSDKQVKRKRAAEQERPSIMQKLKKFKEKVASMPRKDKEKRKEMER